MATDGKPAQQYSIRVASRLTGISPHTLRMWERRYGFPVPERTPGGARRYSSEDVERLKMIARALEAGYRPNEVVGKPIEMLAEILVEQAEVLPPPAPDHASGPSLDRAIKNIEADDIDAVRKELRAAVAVLGPKRFLIDFAHPLIVRIGERWKEGHLTVQQEHLTSELITTQVRSLMAGYEATAGSPTVLLTTLPDELHSLGLQMVALYLSLSGASVRLLGPNAPIHDIVAAAVALDVDVVGISVSVASQPRPTREHIEALLRELPRKLELWIGGDGSVDLGPVGRGARYVHSFEAIDEVVKDWRRSHA